MSDIQPSSDKIAQSVRRSAQAVAVIWAIVATAPAMVMFDIARQNWALALLSILDWKVTMPIGVLILATLAVGLGVGVWWGCFWRRASIQARFRTARADNRLSVALSSPEAVREVEAIVGPF